MLGSPFGPSGQKSPRPNEQLNIEHQPARRPRDCYRTTCATTHSVTSQAVLFRDNWVLAMCSWPRAGQVPRKECLLFDLTVWQNRAFSLRFYANYVRVSNNVMKYNLTFAPINAWWSMLLKQNVTCIQISATLHNGPSITEVKESNMTAYNGVCRGCGYRFKGQDFS